MPYLKHAENLVPTGSSKPRGEIERRSDLRGRGRHPAPGRLASPIILLQVEKVEVAKLALYKLESRNGRREIVFSPKKQPKAIRVGLPA